VYGADHAVGAAVGPYIDGYMSGGTATRITTGTANPQGAALTNSAFGPAVDYDDTFEAIVIQPPPLAGVLGRLRDGQTQGGERA